MEELTSLLATLGTYVRWLVIILGAYFVALWWASVVWTFLDIRGRSRDIIVRIASTLLVLIFSLPGVVIYLILRPKETLAEAYERDLESEYLLRDLEEKDICPSCGSRAREDFVYCPVCGSALKRECASCGKYLRLDWNLCPHCGRRVVSPAVSRLGPDAVTERYDAGETRRAAGIDTPA